MYSPWPFLSLIPNSFQLSKNILGKSKIWKLQKNNKKWCKCVLKNSRLEYSSSSIWNVYLQNIYNRSCLTTDSVWYKNVSIVHVIDTVISPMTIQHVSLIMIYKYLLHVYNLNEVETKMINVFGNNQ